MKKYQREISKQMMDLRAKTPEYKTRSIEETEMLLHKYRVIARKRQIFLQIQDNKYGFKPFDLSSYIIKERRVEILKTIWSIVKFQVLQFKP